MTTDSRR